MPLRIGFLGVAHMHAQSYAAALESAGAAAVGVWDSQSARSQEFGSRHGIEAFADRDALLDRCDAVAVASENAAHLELLQAAAAAGKPALCEKPIVCRTEDGAALAVLESGGARIMTAFPCRYSPVFRRLRERVSGGELGEVRAVCATNRGRCPFDWFVDPELSGGGAMIDHVVHVADLLRVLLGSEVRSVCAQVGSNLHGQPWEDTAMLTLELGNGVFATLDSSWSRPAHYKTWGDVILNVVGDYGVTEADLFGQGFELYGKEGAFGLIPFGSDADRGLVSDFVRFARGEIACPISAHDGWKAVEVALAGYESARSGQPVAIA